MSDEPRDCPPRYATPRTPARRTLGTAAARIGEQLGTPFMPWQRQVLDTALEIEDGQFVYREVIVTVPRQSGKLLDVRTPILTEAGWKTVGTVLIGDRVHAADGVLTRVVDATEIALGRPCYEVEFSDGSVITADGEHPWWVWDRNRKTHGRAKVPRDAWRVATTEEIFGDHRREHNGKDRASGVRTWYRYQVDPRAVVQTPEADLPIDPYVLGYWLGDGSKSGPLFAVGAEDHDHLLSELRRAGYHPSRDVFYDRPIGRCWTVAIARQGLKEALRELGVLGTKHVPDLYMTAAPDQRRALLAGLMDSDGCIGGSTRTPSAQFGNTNQRLTQQVHELVRSLGQLATLRESHATLYGKDCGPKYCVSWTPTENPCRLPRKAARWRPPVDVRKMCIVNVHRVPTVPTRCIAVDHPSHIYLVGRNFTPTHNTTSLLSLILARALHRPRQSIIYTAQSRADARKKWSEDWLPVLEVSPFKEHFHKRLANGDEALIFGNGSRQGLVAGTKKSGHGSTLDLGIIDEAFAQADARLEQALKPAMITRNKLPHPGAQLWVVSTAGTLAISPYLWSKVEAGREIAQSGLNKAVAYFEWSAGEDEDPSDEETWWRCMPALGRTATAAAVRADFMSMDLHEFMRAYGNMWTTIAIDPVIPIVDWMALADLKENSTEGVPVVLGVDVTPGREYASIAAAGVLENGSTFVDVLKHQAGTGWVAPAVGKLVEKHEVAAVIIDPASPAGSLVQALSDEGGVNVQPVQVRELAEACEGLFDAVEQHRVHHPGQQSVTAALDGAVKRWVGDGKWAWGRRSSGTDISPLVACTLAHWGAESGMASAGEIWSLDAIVAGLRAQQAGQTAPAPTAPTGAPAPGNPAGVFITPIA